MLVGFTDKGLVLAWFVLHVFIKRTDGVHCVALARIVGTNEQVVVVKLKAAVKNGTKVVNCDFDDLHSYSPNKASK
jgi:2-methylcitrate dehydratase PrpD